MRVLGIIWDTFAQKYGGGYTNTHGLQKAPSISMEYHRSVNIGFTNHDILGGCGENGIKIDVQIMK